MILAAGRGHRMSPLSDHTPKPLLEVNGEPLIVRHIRKLVAAGFSSLTINLWHLGYKITGLLGDGSHLGANIHYSFEPQLLGAAGGVRLAMQRGLITEPFLLVSADIYCDFDFKIISHQKTNGAHLLLVNNPPHNPKGDFSLSKDGSLKRQKSNALTYAGIGIYHPKIFSNLRVYEPQEILPILLSAIKNKVAQGQYYDGNWCDVGTPQALQTLRDTLKEHKNNSPAPK